MQGCSHQAGVTYSGPIPAWRCWFLVDVSGGLETEQFNIIDYFFENISVF